jgi:hypothetical protein
MMRAFFIRVPLAAAHTFSAAGIKAQRPLEPFRRPAPPLEIIETIDFAEGVLP